MNDEQMNKTPSWPSRFFEMAPYTGQGATLPPMCDTPEASPALADVRSRVAVTRWPGLETRTDDLLRFCPGRFGFQYLFYFWIRGSIQGMY